MNKNDSSIASRDGSGDGGSGWIRGRFFDPHPRSAEAIGGLAAYRGGQAGCNYAEAFEVVMRRI